MQELKVRLARLLIEKSYKEGDFTLTSGRKSDYYFDCKQTALHPEGAYLLGRLFLHLLEGEAVDAVAGMTLGADPLVTAASMASFMAQDGTLPDPAPAKAWPACIIRKQSKGHGTNQYLEGLGNLPAGCKVALLEDVVTTAGTLLTSIQRVQDAGFIVSAVATVLDREEGGRENLRNAGFELKALFTRNELKTLGLGTADA
ncbi:orotate phosphoribosyltransferase [Megalodesulfovibrio paquesii]